MYSAAFTSSIQEKRTIFLVYQYQRKTSIFTSPSLSCALHLEKHQKSGMNNLSISSDENIQRTDKGVVFGVVFSAVCSNQGGKVIFIHHVLKLLTERPPFLQNKINCTKRRNVKQIQYMCVSYSSSK